MRFDFGNFEEEKLGKPYDLALLSRILPFVKPYRFTFLASVILMFFITMLDLAIPYATKLAIDRYIVPTTLKTTSKEAGTTISRDRYLKVDLNDPDIMKVVTSHPALFTTEGNNSLISLEHLEQLNLTDQMRLRKKDMSGVVVITGAILVIVFFSFLFNFIQKLVMEYAGQMIMHRLRMHLFSHIQTLSVSFFNRNPVGRLVTRVTNDVQNMHEMFTSVMTFLVKDIFLVIGIAVILTVVSPKLALVSFLVLPFVVFASVYFARDARGVFRDLRVKVAQINSRFSETIQGIKVVQLFQNEHDNDRRFRDLNHDNYLSEMRQIHIFALFLPVIELLGSVAIALIIYYGGLGVISETLTLGSLVAFISYMKMFFRPVRDMAEKYNILQSSMASAERIFLILDSRETLEIRDSGSETDFGKIETIEFNKVSFAYTPDEPVLENISFHVDAGDVLAVVGPSGAGKTSLINLLVRFYDPISGRVMINGRDLRDFKPSQIRSRIALVTQDPFLFSGTVKENIANGSRDISDHELQTILELSNCRSFINKLPKGVDTVLFDGGRSLSSGERQLISIARAIASEPDLIILDEATSYIDTESEMRIQDALDNLMSSRTSFVIAHRISTARNADRIIVLKRGQIIETGHHDALMNKKGLYYKLNMIKG